MATDLATYSKGELVDMLESAKRRAKSLAEKGKRAMQVTTTTGFTVLGGAASGALMAKQPKVPGTQLDSTLVVGGLFVGLGVSDVMGEFSDETAAFGAGVLAGEAAVRTRDALA